MTVALADAASELEEDGDAALRSTLGLRPHLFKSNDTPLDSRPCPHWCHYG